MIRRKQSARTAQRVVENFERISALNKSSSLSSCCRSDEEGLLINGPYQRSNMLGQHESKDRILSCEKGISLLFQYFYAFSFYAPLLKSGGASAPRPPVFDAPGTAIIIDQVQSQHMFMYCLKYIRLRFLM